MPREKKDQFLALASAQRTLDETSEAFDGKPYDDLYFYVDVTVFVGGILVVSLEASPDGGTTWHTNIGPWSTGAIVATGQTAKRCEAPIGSKLRIKADLTPGADMTFSVRVEKTRVGD
jgi:hypothetical protein